MKNDYEDRWAAKQQEDAKAREIEEAKKESQKEVPAEAPEKAAEETKVQQAVANEVNHGPLKDQEEVKIDVDSSTSIF